MEGALRSDARRNRERIVRAAHAAFAEQGLDCCVSDIADRAGVGVGTLYRRFPTKDALVDAILEQIVEDLAAVGARALEADDPARGLRDVFAAVMAWQARDRGFLEAISLRLGAPPLAGELRERLLGPMAQLLARAQAAGEVRADLGPEDLPVLLRMAGGAARPHPGGEAARGSETCGRFLDLLFDGMRPRETA